MKNISLENFKENLSKDLEFNSIPSLLKTKPANYWIEQAKKRPIPKMLFGKLWFEGELCILFADTTLGKSILAVQLGNSISTGYSTCWLELEAEQQPVIYIDFELSDRQFECRYSDDYENHFEFNDKFFRSEIEAGVKVPKKYKSFEDYLCESIENTVIHHSAKVLIIDNISYLKSGTEKASEPTTLMIFLSEIKKKYKLF